MSKLNIGQKYLVIGIIILIAILSLIVVASTQLHIGKIPVSVPQRFDPNWHGVLGKTL